MMKFVVLTTLTFTTFCVKTVVPSSLHVPSEVVHEGLSEADLKELEFLHHHFSRPKRSGSGDILNTIKSAVVAGISKKIGQLAKGSAGASAGFSSGSSGGKSYGHDYHSYDHHPPPESYDHKNYNFWELKKSILNTLLQAVKAIKGGVVAIKGQLIKGSGYVISGSGKLISAKGEAVTKLGKNIIHSAVLVPYNKHHPSGHAEYGPPSGHYSAPSAPSDVYHNAPSAIGPEYSHSGPGAHYTEHHDDHKLPADAQAGILILKKIKNGHKTSTNVHHHAEESKIPPFKTVPPSSPSFGTIFGKFLSASTSLDPHKPEAFGHTATGDDVSSIEEQVHHDTHPQYTSSESDFGSQHHYEEPRYNIKPHQSDESHSVEISHSRPVASFVDEGKPLTPTGTSYGVPFEQSYHNFAEQKPSEYLYGEASQNKPQVLTQEGVKLTQGEKAALSKPLHGSDSTTTNKDHNDNSASLLNNFSNQFYQALPSPASTNSFNQNVGVQTLPSKGSSSQEHSFSNEFYQDLPSPISTNSFSQNVGVRGLPNKGTSSHQNEFYQDLPSPISSHDFNQNVTSSLLNNFYQELPNPASTNSFSKSKYNFGKPVSSSSSSTKHSPRKPSSYLKDFSKDFYRSRPKPSSTSSFIMHPNQNLMSLDSIPGLDSFQSFGGESLSQFPLLPTPLPQSIDSLLKGPEFGQDMQVMHVYNRPGTKSSFNNKKPSSLRVNSGSNKPRKPGINVVKSIAYELTPDGPKRLT